jgi:uncharacterized protein YyaL (SSP411 family)/aryl-alcohol dehydrogenase-like predicted oxidoreductase
LERARREDRPILLSVGYAACHWCHVMERESFENEAIARLMNEHFVCIKVDREERPDIDDVYMSATVALSGHGGWPMTVFLTPDQRPFFAGTYYPPVEKYGRPGFTELLQRIAELWRTERDTLLRQASELTSAVAAQARARRNAPVSEDAVIEAVSQLKRAFDPRWGGFSPAPKFPPASALHLLLRQHARTRDPETLNMVVVTLNAMKNGGIYDHVAGGFARYSTDERWLVPHFEKMLYDNAQLARVYLEAYQVTGNPEYARVARETFDYVLREMQGPEGGFYSATDADSEGEEGKFFVWHVDELHAVLERDEAEAFAAYYDIRSGGNWEGKSIPNTPRSLAEVAKELGLQPGVLQERVTRARARVYEARQQRVHPLLDDKVLLSWNALMVGALAEGHRILRERRYLDAAVRAARYVTTTLVRPDGGLYRTARAGRVHLEAYLEDYAFLADALLDLYEAGGDPEWLSEALAFTERMVVDFEDKHDGGFFATSHTHEPLIVRPREMNDGAIPSANAVAARVLARLSFHLGRAELRDLAVRTVRAFGREIERLPRGFTGALGVVDFLLEPPLELVVAGAADDHATEAFHAQLARRFLPNRVLAHATPEALENEALELPLIEGKASSPAVYVCRNFVCHAPVTSPNRVAGAVEAALDLSQAARQREIATQRLPGFATPEGTREYAERHARAHGFAELRSGGHSETGRRQLQVSRLGFGGYRVDAETQTHRDALKLALRSGVNLVDTSTNYTDGSSERLIGEALFDLCSRGDLDRTEVVVLSKIGYVQGANYALAEQRKAEGRPFPEMVEYDRGIWHCIHPEWLEDQLTRSLTRLGLETLDVCLLHNPEYFFTDAAKRGRGTLTERRREFYARVEAAFRHLEQEVQRGRIRSYGVSSNTSGAEPDHKEKTSLSEFLACARRAGGEDHHFRVLQLPYNLIESKALLQKSEGADAASSVLELAEREGVAVLVNRPLNAIVGDALLRLADPKIEELAVDFETQRSVVAGLEEQFRSSFAPRLRTGQGASLPKDLLDWATTLGRIARDIASLEQWKDLEEYRVRPQLDQVLSALNGPLASDGSGEWSAFRQNYLNELDQLLAAGRRRAAERSQARVRALRESLDSALPDSRREEPLSRLALWALLSSPAVTTVLVGMRRPEWVKDALETLAWAPHAEPERMFRALVGKRI